MKNKFSNISASLLTYFVMMVSFVLIRIAFLYIKLPFSSTVNDLITTILVQGFFMFFLAVFMFSQLKRQPIKKTFNDFGYNKLNFTPILISVLIGILCYFFNIFVASFFNTIIGLFGYEQMPSFATSISTQDYSIFSFIIQVVSVAIIPAICEETAHRGLLLNGLKGSGIVNAILLSSLLFGLMHLNINQFFYATILGFIIAMSAVISKSIIPAIIIHFMNNFISTYMSFASHNGWLLGDFTTQLTKFMYGSGNVLFYFIILALTLTVIILLIVVLFYFLLRHTRIKQVKKTLQDVAVINKDVITSGGSNQMINMYQINQLMMQYNIKSLGSMIFTDIESKGRKFDMAEKLMLIATIVVGSLVTISTFIWGII